MHCEAAYFGSCSDEGSVAIETRTYVALFGSVGTTVEGADGQFLMTHAVWTDGEDEPAQQPTDAFLYAGRDFSERFDELASAYCYRVQLTS